MVFKGDICTVGDKNRFSAYTSLLERVLNNEWPDYNFQDSVYDKALSKFTVICNIHGKFTIRPNDLKNGHGCPTCGVERTTAATAKDDVVYKEELKNIHEDTVECIGDYVNTKTKILHRCTCCKLEWLVTPAKMLQASHACPACRPSNYTGFKLDAPATLYYLSINNGEAYKIGVTNRSIQKRYSRTDLLKITVLKEWYFDIGQDAYSLEQSILIQYKEFKYIGKKLLDSGNTELFFTDVLNLAQNKEV